MGTPARAILRQKHHDAIRLLLDGLTTEVVAARVGVSRQVLFKWRQRPDFKAAMRSAAMDRWRDATLEAIASKPLAIKVLRDLSDDDAVPSAVRRSAAADLARLGDQGVIATDFAARLEALEGEGSDD